jgi:hypothetical protein
MRRRLVTAGTAAALAAVLTLANAAKPLTIDDAAYLAVARQAAIDPLDPYGTEVFWYEAPEPAMHVLAPPVLPLWWALGLRWVSAERPAAWKLWLFPFALLLAGAAWALARRFARGCEAEAAALLVLSPAVLPSFNLMLDVPALALSLAALAGFLAACDRGSVAGAALAGLTAGLAAQTKYTGAVAPVAMLLAAALAGRPALGAVAAGSAAVVFAGWEGLVALRYGESHFLHHLRDPGGHLAGRSGLAVGLLGQLGGLAPAVTLAGLAALRVPGVVLAALAAAWLAGAAAVAAGASAAAPLLFGASAGVAVGTALALAVRALLRPGWQSRRGVGGRFLVGWLVVEVAAAYALSPFPAARRCLGVLAALTLLAVYAAARARRRGLLRAAVAFGVLLGGAFAAIDTLDAAAERWAAETGVAAARGVAGPGGRVRFVGHWGFQFYAERAGALPVAPGDELRPGDAVLRPYPWPLAQHIDWPEEALEFAGEVVWRDALPLRTQVTFYSGRLPFERFDGPRRAVAVYRVRSGFVARTTP